jgi:hypothetical protein
MRAYAYIIGILHAIWMRLSSPNAGTGQGAA